MIAKINPSSANFHAIHYLEHKVGQGKGYVMECRNIPVAAPGRPYSAEQLAQYFIDYTSRNDRIRKGQFHVSFSVKRKEMTHEQIKEIADKWLNEMGYGQDGQPVIIYAHTDTENNHIHIVTSRIDPAGKKIDHSNERVRGRKVLERLLGIDTERDFKQHIDDILSNYKFASVGQFRAIASSFGYESFLKDEEVKLKRDGAVVGGISVKEIEAKLSPEADLRTHKLVGGLLRQCKQECNSRQELVDTARAQYGLHIVFFGSKDKPSGYSVVDHRTKTVYKGGKIMPIQELLDIVPIDERYSQSGQFLSDTLQQNPGITTFELNRLLSKKLGAFIKKGKLYFGRKEYELPDVVVSQLKENDRMRWWKGFRLTDETQIAIVAKMAKADISCFELYRKDDLSFTSGTVETLKGIWESCDNSHDIFTAAREQKMAIVNENGDWYCVDFQSRCVVNIADTGLDAGKLGTAQQSENDIRQNPLTPTPQEASGQIQQHSTLYVPQSPNVGASHGTKREWEVGSQPDADDPDRKLKQKWR